MSASGEAAIPIIEPVALKSVLVTALLNPVVVLMAFWMGRSATQWQKLPVAAFAAALAGSVVLYVAVRLGWTATGVGRAAAGVFVAQFFIALAWAAVGYRFGRRRP